MRAARALAHSMPWTAVLQRLRSSRIRFLVRGEYPSLPFKHDIANTFFHSGAIEF